jgi:hypothetical protein
MLQGGAKLVQLSESLTMMKALADPSRLILLNALLDSPHYVEELAEQVQLAESTVSFHLKKLEAANLVARVKDQYYAMYSANRKALGLTLQELVAVSDIQKHQQEERLRRYRAKVLRAFFQDGRLQHLPVQKKKRRIVLEYIAAGFRAGRTYTEHEVNAIITKTYADYCTIRRELIGARFLARDHHVYWVVTEVSAAPLPPDEQSHARKEQTMDRKTALKRAYKEHPPAAGIFRITNKANGKILIGKGLNVQGKLNAQYAQLQWGSHRNRALQQDWQQHGQEQFTLEVVDQLDPSDDPRQDVQQELAALEELWLDKLRPYGEKGYNAPPKPGRAATR